LLREEIAQRAAALPDVVVWPRHVSMQGARTFSLTPEAARGPREAFLIGQEFAQFSSAYGGSLRMRLPPALAQEVYAKGWGAPHKRTGAAIVFSPRNEAEREVVWQLLQRSYAWARGDETH
jgi:phospholipase/carboxylesterase